MQTADHGFARDYRKALAGTIIDVEKAPPVTFWRPMQWQAIVIIGGALMRKRTLSQRHPPSIGTVICVNIGSSTVARALPRCQHGGRAGA